MDDEAILRARLGDIFPVVGWIISRDVASTARRKFNSGLSCQRTASVGPFERFGHGFVERLNKG
jgi:hypothetical protein